MTNYDWRLYAEWENRSVSCRRRKSFSRCKYRFRNFVDQRREGGHDDGTLLADERAARKYALRIISELIDGGGYDDPGLSMIVKDEAERQIFAIPFSKARAVC